MSRRAAWLSGILVGAGVVVLALRGGPRPVTVAAARASAAGPPAFVGEAVCASCHARQALAWTGSHHQLAIQPASAATVLGDFADARFSWAGVSSRFFRRDGKYLARTDGPDGALADYEIAYTFGVAPLQQYLVAFPGGRFQALEIAWDTRPAPRGQRWFHLYPDEKIDHRDALHWTGVVERWNVMCADCHATNVRKAWDATTQAYATRFSGLGVACEACHGPGSRHVAWASAASHPPDAHKGLTIALDERDGISWGRDPATGNPVRSRPRDSQREIEMCARCHARRGLIHEDDVHGQPVGDDYYVALLDDDLYYPDGQIKGEVYEYGSFIQSRMFAEGVSCSDCHDPHRPELRATGDNLCLKCHAEARYFTRQHHFHAPSSPGARCVACHMPAVTYMIVDPRRDHSLRVPRPDLSVQLGVPNPCNGCHRKRSAAWAARTVEKWYGHRPTGRQQFGAALANARQGAPGAAAALAALIADRGQPAIARASALARLPARVTPATLAVVAGALRDEESLVRRAAVRALAEAELQTRAALVAPLLEDAVRAVRIEAALALADVPAALLPSASRGARDRASAEFVAAQELNGDRPEAHLDLALLYMKQQGWARAASELERALQIDQAFVPASVNLADLYRVTGRDDAAETLLRRSLEHAPANAALLHALGLVLVREKRLGEAIACFAAAARHGDDARYGYVYAVALHDAGQARAAVRELENVLRRHPYDVDALAARMAFAREAGDLADAATYARRLAALDAPPAGARQNGD
jgi:predicted CXXCH cytochrome family protein